MPEVWKSWFWHCFPTLDWFSVGLDFLRGLFWTFCDIHSRCGFHVYLYCLDFAVSGLNILLNWGFLTYFFKNFFCFIFSLLFVRFQLSLHIVLQILKTVCVCVCTHTAFKHLILICLYVYWLVYDLYPVTSVELIFNFRY